MTRRDLLHGLLKQVGMQRSLDRLAQKGDGRAIGVESMVDRKGALNRAVQGGQKLGCFC